MESNTQPDLFSWDISLLGAGYAALANLDFSLEHIATMRTYEMIQHAEAMRIQGQYEKMIEARKELKKQDPNIFEAYMTQIK